MYRKNLKNHFNLIGVLLIHFIVAPLTFADHNNGNSWQQSNWDDQHVIVFRDCGYSGPSKSVPVGDYSLLKDIGIEQNAISSIIVPEGLAVEIFQRRKYNGHWYRINQNQICLKGKWNDRIGSMRVVRDNTRNSYGFNPEYTSEQPQQGKNCHPFVVRSFDGAGAIRFVGEEDKLTRVDSGRTLQGDICQKGTARVELAKKDRGGEVILEIAGNEYRFEPWSQYDDFRRNWYRRYITIDLPKKRKKKNNIVYGANGWGNTPGFGRRYSSGVDNGANWGNNYQGKWYRPVAVNKPKPPKPVVSSSNNPPKNCASYSVTGNHRDVGVRFFVGDQDFHLTGYGTKKKQLCHSGNIRFELAKKKIPGEVVVRIGGKAFVFGAGDTGDRFANHWYRKYFRVNLR
ncbi:MAG: hypothetical protein KTR18_05655 [Acidiferrobacterales bacterium]|nr:hypothetical protein [Acidiferrobacterales bacterium]